MLIRAFALWALCLQVLAPAALAAGGVDAASLLCAPSSALSGDAQQAVAELLQSLGEEERAPDVASEHCPFCISASGYALAEPAAPGAALYEALGQEAPSFDARFFAETTGPPLGQRGPPVFN